jgi:hypothetical protein
MRVVGGGQELQYIPKEGSLLTPPFCRRDRLADEKVGASCELAEHGTF